VSLLETHAIGTDVARLEGLDKVTGRARYAFEYEVDDVAYLWLVPATIARGRVTGIDPGRARELPGFVDVIWAGNAVRLADALAESDAELAVFQSDRVSYRDQVVAAVVADDLETAREAAALIRVEFESEPASVVLRSDDPGLYAPSQLNAGYDTDTSVGDVERAIADAPYALDQTYSTPSLHNQPMEPHASIARWDGGHLTVWDSNQAPSAVAKSLATAFGLDVGSGVHVVTEHVGGGFGSKGTGRPNVIITAMAARIVGRPCKLALPRQAMFSLVGYRTPTIQRIQLAADGAGTLLAIAHDTVEQTSQLVEFAEQTGECTRHMYAAPNRRVTHRLARLDVPTPRWMRAPGECPGMFAVESALDELAERLGLDPIELRLRNEPAVDPSEGLPFSSRHYVECLQQGARRFGWDGRDPRPGARREGRTLIGTGVAGSTYPVHIMPSNARVRVDEDGRYEVAIAAADIGQGARTVLAQIAADALGVGMDRIDMRIGDSTLPVASVAGGSSGTSSWGWAVTKAARGLREQLGRHDGIPAGGLEVSADIKAELAAQEPMSRNAYGAHFVEVRVDADTGEVRVSRALGVFAAGRIVNPRTARSQFLGGMTMGLSMALMEEGEMDRAYGDYANHDLAEYHIAVNADVQALEAVWLEETDEHLSPAGNKGIGEIGIVGIAAAVTNAVWHATGHRVRDLPVRLDKVFAAAAAVVGD
jgi:xanthine dehydrogenase YagR molybdenum-binding subunit